VNSASARKPSAMVSTSRAGELNRARLLKTLYAYGPLARPELARLTGSTRATIGQIVQPLIDEDVLEEHVPVSSGARGGKPARPVWFSDDGWPVAAVLLLPDRAQAALVTASGRIVTAVEVKFKPRKGNHDVIVRRVVECLNRVIAAATSPLRGIGIAVGGMVDTETGSVVRVDLAPGLNGLAIGPEVTRNTGLPTFVDLQPRAQALGDLLFGPGRGEDNLCSVYIGDGIGAGFILDGALHRGARGAGGEVGHAVVDLQGTLCACGLTGCWETLAATRWLRAAAAARAMADPATITTARLAQAAASDPASAALLTEYAANIGIGIANIQQSLGVGLTIVHGDPVGGGEDFRVQIENQVRRRAFAHPGGPVRIVFADQDDYATLRGAAVSVLFRSMHVAF
jgi:predicted NBD/HSP70 family sugar kinase